MDPTHVTDLLPLHPLGLLAPDEARRVESHLATCPACRAELARVRALCAQLTLAVPLTSPPAGLQARLHLRLAQEDPMAAPAFAAPPPPTNAIPRKPWAARLAGLFAPAAPSRAALSAALAVAALLLVTTMVFTVWSGRGEPAASAPRLVLVAAEAAPDAQGFLFADEVSREALLQVSGLPVLSASQQYQLWLVKDEVRISGGLFSVDQSGAGTLQIEAPLPVALYDRVGITIEPVGGSPGPTGPRVLGGTL